jgi:hypothetical protein
MPSSVTRVLPVHRPPYSKAELLLRSARSFPPGSKRNHHRQVAALFRALFKNKDWLDANTVEGSGVSVTRSCDVRPGTAS